MARSASLRVFDSGPDSVNWKALLIDMRMLGSDSGEI
jgi:hypothetical protein